jgi:hypothetical protein
MLKVILLLNFQDRIFQIVLYLKMIDHLNELNYNDEYEGYLNEYFQMVFFQNLNLLNMIQIQLFDNL